jgi:hypothetical protein
MPSEAAREAGREPDRLISRIGFESTHDGLNPSHAAIVGEDAPFGHGARYAADWSLSPMSGPARRNDDGVMEPGEDLSRRASELVEDARRFQSAATQPGCHVAVPDALESLEEALQVLSAAWYQLAPVPSRAAHDGLSREAEVQLIGALHDVASRLARSARTCRDARSVATSITARRVAA